MYEDDDIIVTFFNGNSDFLLVTFGDLVTLANGNAFYAEQPVRKAELNCVGFMAKSANWFPASSMEAAYRHITPILSRFTQRITYGGSMGGYAAIKFSALLQADRIVAFCPQWSIDVDECGGIDPGWSAYFQPRMTGMSIRPSDIAGKLYCFVDLGDPTDAFHAGRIAAIAESVTIVNVPMCSHHVTVVLAGTENLQTIISLCRSDDIIKLTYAVSLIRRKNILRKIVVMKKLFYRRPGQAIRIIYARKDDFDFTIIAAQLIDQIMKRPDFLADPVESAALLDRVQDMVPPDIRQRILMANCKQFGRNMCIRSFRHHILVYDLYLEYCVHVDPVAYRQNIGRYILVSYRSRGGHGRLYLAYANVETELVRDANGSALRPINIDDSRNGDWMLETIHPGVFALKTEGRYLSAQFDGEIKVDRPAISDWELLTFSTI